MLLARALVAEPSLLLLDEPTNHLDRRIDRVARGASRTITRARSCSSRTTARSSSASRRASSRLDRGRLTSWPGDYRTFLEKKDAWLANEALAEAKFDKKLAQEEVWLRRGVKARRTRDEGRVKALMAMREERAARRAQIGSVRLVVDAAERTGKVVFEADGDHASRTADVPVVQRFLDAHHARRSHRPHRPERRRQDDAAADAGGRAARRTAARCGAAANVQIAYFDQQRAQLDPERTVVDTVADGNDTVTVGGVVRHVHGYLEDFLFPPERARSPVKALSGGERNRLLLARLLTQPANVLVLDEPTNDLDIETLELVESLLVEFPGTMLIVSHDRTFLDNVVTSTLVFEGDGRESPSTSAATRIGSGRRRGSVPRRSRPGVLRRRRSHESRRRA